MSTHVSRSAALAISIASYEISNHADILSNTLCLFCLLALCQTNDVEIQTHAAIAVANLTFKNEYAQSLFGALGVMEILIELLHVPIADVLESITAALANLTSYHDENCHKFIVSNGIHAAVKVLFQCQNNENLLDMDQGDEIQANAAELLTNISRYHTTQTLPYFHAEVVHNLILLCAAPNIQCKRSIPLILGNIAQQNDLRQAIGQAGGIEALFLSLENDDAVVKCNVLWALANLMYYPPNQERAGRFMSEVVSYLLVQHLHLYTENTRIHAALLLGNMVYYNTPNRVRFLETDQAFETVLLYIQNKDPIPIVEGCFRILLSLSYLDSIALYLGAEAQFIPVLLSYLTPPSYSNVILKMVLEVLCNLCLHHDNRQRMYQAQAIEAVVPLHAHPDESIRELSVAIIGHLEDITPEEVLARKREQLPIERVVKLATHSDPLVRAVAAEQIGEHVYRYPANASATSTSLSVSASATGGGAAGTAASLTVSQLQEAVSSIGGIDSLLAILNNPTEPAISLLPALWSLRNLLANNFANQSQFHYRDGIHVLCSILSRAMQENIYAEQVEKVVEGVLLCLTCAVQKHDRNSRRLVMIGLESVLAWASPTQARGLSQHPSTTGKRGGAGDSDKAASPSRGRSRDIYVQSAMQSDSLQALLHNLLLLLGPYNYVVCSNCHRKQDLHGTNCLYCAHRLYVDAAHLNMQHETSPRKKATGTTAGEREGKASGGMSQSTRLSSTEAETVLATAASESKGAAPLMQSRSASHLSKFSLARSLPAKPSGDGDK